MLQLWSAARHWRRGCLGRETSRAFRKSIDKVKPPADAPKRSADRTAVRTVLDAELNAMPGRVDTRQTIASG